MSDNFTLLSQNEIDTLLDFLVKQKEKFGNEVMDQASIDRLISLLHTDGENEIKFDEVVPETKNDANALLVIGDFGSIAEQQGKCVLDCIRDEKTGYMRIVCRNNENGKEYSITPNCMEQLRYVNGDSSEWGYAVPPLTFDKIAVLLSVKYTKKAFDEVSRSFAKCMYGDEEASIAELYMPTAQQLVKHMCD